MDVALLVQKIQYLQPLIQNQRIAQKKINCIKFQAQTIKALMVSIIIIKMKFRIQAKYTYEYRAEFKNVEELSEKQ